jgi:sterol desaturase/sphingolipid hydroxylase (fatty acid hydroxylase superfamily)
MLDLGLLFAAGLAGLLIVGEALYPARSAQWTEQWSRWPANLGLGALTLLIGRALAVVAPVAAAGWAERNGVGLLNLMEGGLMSGALAKLILTIVIMDFAIYWQHRAFHLSGWLWRWHKLHHADGAMDVSTGVRFHPVEIVVSLGWKSVCVVALGAPPSAVALFELWLMADSLIEHSNLNIPPKLDGLIRRVWVTPAMHAVHHSAHGNDAQHNFGFAISLWDQWFGTSRAVAAGPVIGLPGSLPQSPAP